ncbi:TRAP transporter large permease [Loktanella sp. M215]|uniref:TRAP transporter large permease n=1 Tax=Loktanella sp. M215 TaxID=2675431 RepID=UPI001F027B59|nr:TRAP transporter large permease subunit [Loktanella sp. M215]MCF7701778.1 TRAP transporter large permease subunit [Loktanella sp. M215]
MEWWIFLSGSLMLLLTLFLTGAPLFVGFLLVNIGTVLLVIGPRGFILVGNSIFDSANIGSLSAIPLFILMGEILTRSGSVENLFRAMDGLIGRIKGRQYVLTVLISVIFGALSGAAMAVAAMLGRSLYPTMRARGYDRDLSIGSILAGASLAPIIPPSVLIVVIATLADVSVGRLLIAGVMPGLVAAGLILAYIALRIWQRPDISPDTSEDEGGGWRGKAASVALLMPFSIIIFCVMGLILLGIATPSEAAATGVLGAIVVAVIYRQFSFRMLRESIAGAMQITAMIMIIVIASNLFGQLLGFTGATRGLVDWGSALSDQPYLLLAMLLTIVFALCMFIDQIALMLILVPIYKPLVDVAGFDPIWFWLLVLLNLAVGGITPPFGYTMFAFKAAAPEVTIGQVYRAAWPFVGVFVVLMVLIVLMPGIATWLPSVTK